jgi:NADPH2:quinone reductase
VRAIRIHAFGPVADLRLDTVPDPEPGPGEVVVATRAMETNYPDLLVIEGKYQFKPPLPFSPGKAASGVVSALGSGVAGLAVGDRVSVQVEYGAYAEQLVAPAAQCTPLPPGLGFEDAAALGLTYLTAHFALVERARLVAGEWVLVLGAAGGVGLATVQLAHALGGRVIALVRGREREAVLRASGAEHVLDLHALGDLREDLRGAVREITGGHGADVVFDPVGDPVTSAALRAMAWCGRLLIIGFVTGEIPKIPANYLLVKNISAVGLQWSDYRDRVPERMRAGQAEIFRLAQEDRLDPAVYARYPLSKTARALEDLRAGGTYGKLLVLPEG